MSELSTEARSLLREARGFDEPTAADADRIHASVLAKVGIAIGAGAGVTAATTSLAAAPATALGVAAMKIGAAIVVAGSLATGGYIALRPSTAQRPVAAVAAEERATVSPPPSPEAPALAVAPTQVSDERRSEATPVPHAKPARARAAHHANERAPQAVRSTTPDLEGEAHLLEQADADLRRGDANAALARLAEHATKYPTGALREEREGMRVVALCRSGRAAEGSAAAERFLARSPRSALATRIRAACGGE